MISEYREMKLSDGQIINIETEYIYYLSEGTAQLWELHSDGEEILINVLKPDDAIRSPNVNFESVYELRTNRKDTHFFIYKWSPVNSIEEKYFLLNKVTATLMRGETLNLIKRQKFVRDRLISLFSFLVQEYGESHGNNSFIIKELFTHEQLASLVLSTRTTVTRILNDLKKENILTYLNGHICLNKNVTEDMDAAPILEVV
ncbi:Crp/Fnr family transcriptional regulator [Virgibacillus sp. YIM 98842]|jgi:CRP-like cAMP-binding protein|uniref:Crp/Fnr family transcriptional regulator n=1 Tax=Virgibacillus sp. YIM 98842 TaxID=2663533 RepID=UPI0013DA31A6|nr:Crp/Fnr family transcriptional regulator [Virgibacillus sp. YIM 98842]